ncbi:MAG: acyl carrier protein [Desulfobacteraceae bacterium]
MITAPHPAAQQELIHYLQTARQAVAEPDKAVDVSIPTVEAPLTREAIDKVVGQLFFELTNVQEIDPDIELTDQGLDSMSGTELITHLEIAFNIEIDPDILFEYPLQPVQPSDGQRVPGKDQPQHPNLEPGPVQYRPGPINNKNRKKLRVLNLSGRNIPGDQVLTLDSESVDTIVSEIRRYADHPFVYVVSKDRSALLMQLLSALKALYSPCYPYAILSNSTSQVNSSECAYRLFDKPARSNRDHSFTREILEDIEQLSKEIAEHLFLDATVENIEKKDNRYRTRLNRSGEAFVIESTGLIVAVNDRVGEPNKMEWENQSAFKGTIVSGFSDETKNIEWRNKNVVDIYTTTPAFSGGLWAEYGPIQVPAQGAPSGPGWCLPRATASTGSPGAAPVG